MKFKSKFSNLSKLYNYLWFLALLNIFFSTDFIHAKTFSINDIEISTPFEINFNKNEIIDKAFQQAFNRLILSTTQTKDQKKLKKISLGSIKGMIETFSIKEEKFVNQIYYLTLNVSFNKKKIFDFLERKNIFPSLPIKKNIFFIPIIFDENKNEILMFSDSYLFSNWNLKNKKYHLLNYILPTEDLEDLNFIKFNSQNLENYDFKDIIEKYSLKDYIIMIVFRNDQEIRVLNKINFNETIDLKNLRFKNLNLDNIKDIEEFSENLKTVYENYWKSKNEINTSIKLYLTVSINNNNNSKISEFEEMLSNTDLIYDFYIFKFNNKNNIYKIIFNGTPNNFLKTMNYSNYEVNTKNKIWVIK